MPTPFPFTKLYLASSSPMRHRLLQDAQIDFVVITQHADERAVSGHMPLDELVKEIAIVKMKHVALPQGIEAQEGSILYVLSADTLSQDAQGNMLGKPKNRSEAIEHITSAAQGSCVATGFCLERKIYRAGNWLTDKQIVQSVMARCIVAIPDDAIDYYLDNSDAMQACGSIIIEGIGMQFVQEIHGSYSAILGLPMFELRKALIAIQKK